MVDGGLRQQVYKAGGQACSWIETIALEFVRRPMVIATRPRTRLVASIVREISRQQSSLTLDKRHYITTHLVNGDDPAPEHG